MRNMACRWEPNSYGYHAEDGKKLTGVVTPSRNSGEEYGPGFATGDTVGAGILLESQEMFFTCGATPHDSAS